jgi:ubiquinone biosynthesis accessory factor UbiK
LAGRALECTKIVHGAARQKKACSAFRTKTAHLGRFDRTARPVGGSMHELCATFEGITMKQPNDVFNDLQARFGEMLKNSPVKDVERNVKAMLSQGFSKLDLVTREEFDTQAQVLARTRLRLEELERRVAELEQKLAAQPDAQ